MMELSTLQIAALKQALQAREQALRDDIRREMSLKEDYAQLASEAPDPGDASFADLSVDLGNAAIGRDVAELRAVQNTYARIGNGSYGECVECGYAIPFQRLQAQPTAERCAPCQEMHEKTHMDAMKGGTL
jgi:DnaK suppressor protein